MKAIRTLVALAAALAFAATPAFAQSTKIPNDAGATPGGAIVSTSGAPTVALPDITISAVNQSVIVDASQFATADLGVRGTWSGTLKVQWSNSPTTGFQDGQVTNAAGTTAGAITANQQYVGTVFGRYMKITASAWSSGSAIVTPRLRTAAAGSAAGGGGGGGGGGGDASAANQTAVQADAGSDATKATAVQGITGGKAIPVSASALPLPTGAATAANQTTLNASAASIDTKLSSQATAANQSTAQTSLSAIATSLASLDAKATGGTATFTITRPANTTQYTIGDALNDTAGATAFTFSSVCPTSGGAIEIISLTVTSSIDPATRLVGELWIFDSAFTPSTDNAEFAVSDADALKLEAKIPFALESSSATGATNSVFDSGAINRVVTCTGTQNLRAQPKVLNTYTPASGETVQFRIAYRAVK